MWFKFQTSYYAFLTKKIPEFWNFLWNYRTYQVYRSLVYDWDARKLQNKILDQHFTIKFTYDNDKNWVKRIEYLFGEVPWFKYISILKSVSY